jgi:biotin transport system substrate-specific component
VSTRDIVFIALFAAIVAALGAFPPLMLPVIGVPITAQSLGVMLAGSVLGAKRGSLAIILFLVLVAVGVPILAGGRGGIGVFFGPSGGFLLGWPIGAFVIGWLVERAWTRLDVWRAFAINLIGGVVVIYACGVPWIAVVAETSLTQAAVGSMGFLPGGVIKAAIAAFVAVTVKRSYPVISRAEAGAGRA